MTFVLRLSLILGGLGFASVFAVALLGGGIYLIATGTGCPTLSSSLERGVFAAGGGWNVPRGIRD